MRNLYSKKSVVRLTEKYFTILIICLVIMIPSLVQCNPADAGTWSYRYYTPDNAPVEFSDVISVSSGGQLAIGRVWDSGTSDTAYNPLIVRFDQSGQVLWSKNFTFPGRWYDDLRSVVESSDGGFIATGTALLEGTDLYGNPGVVNAVLILKVDANGNLLWSKLLNNHSNLWASGNRIKATTDGNYVVVGQKTIYYRHDTGVYSTVASGALITKIDTNGQVLFNHAFYGDWTHSLNWSFNDVVQDDDGAYYAIGFAGSEAYSEAIGGGGMLLAKIDSSGSLVWAKKYDYAQDSEGVFVNDFGMRILLSGNTLYVAGVTYTLNISSFSLSGVRNWTKQYSCVRIYDTGISAANDFIHSGDGNFFVTTGGGCQSITKLNPSGAVLWSKNTAPHMPTSLTLEADKGLTLGGWSDQSGTARGGTVSKYDSSGNRCDDKGDIIYTVADIEMLTNAVPNEAVSLLPDLDKISAFAGPALTVEKVCEDIGTDLTADAGANQSASEGNTVTLDASGSTVTGSTIATYSWTQTDSSGITVTLSSNTKINPTFTAPQVDSSTTLIFSLTVTDNLGASSTDTVSITITDSGGSITQDSSSSGCFISNIQK